VIKRISFGSRRSNVAADEFDASWRAAAVAGARAPADARPARIAVCRVLPDLGVGPPHHDGIAVAWFPDPRSLARFESWLRSPAAHAAHAGAASAGEPGETSVVVADEIVVRGEEWLNARWRDGGDRFEHMALARRAHGLTPAEFSQRWRDHAGTVRGADGAALVIPDAARGCAYVQNHPVPGAEDWPYDAVNQVYFDDLAGLQTRIEWFRDNVPAGSQADLVGASWFVAATEELVFSAP